MSQTNIVLIRDSDMYRWREKLVLSDNRKADRKIADIQMYCDNDENLQDGRCRWKPRSNNRKGFLDAANQITASELDCEDEKVLGATYATPTKKETKLLTGRSMITVSLFSSIYDFAN